MSMTIFGAIIIGLSIIVGLGSRFIFKKDDHPIEELAEQVLKDQTGIDIDFSPLSKEEKKEQKEFAAKDKE